MEFYSVVLRQKINIPDRDVQVVTRGNRRFAVGRYSANGRTYEAYRAISNR